MSIRDERRRALLDPLADHLLAQGLNAAGLRALAAAAGTSDRMLLYYFADKDDLLAAVLGHVAQRLAAMLDAAVPAAPRRPFAALLEEVWTAIRTPSLQPCMRLWIEVAARAGRGEAPYDAMAGDIADHFAAWAAARLDAPPSRRREQGALLSAAVDGLAVLAAAGRGELADAASRVSPSAVPARPASRNSSRRSAADRR
jgi:AcrR family transcriptional regulator